MTRTMTSLAPLALAVAIFGAVIWLLLAADNPIGPWLLAAFLLGHGWVHAMYVMPRSAADDTTDAPEWPFDLGRSWLLAGNRDGASLRAIGVVLVAVVVVGYLLAALATVGLLVPADWWPALVLVSTAASAALIGVFFHPALVLGVAIDAVLAAVVLASLWAPGAAVA